MTEPSEHLPSVPPAHRRLLAGTHRHTQAHRMFIIEIKVLCEANLLFYSFKRLNYWWQEKSYKKILKYRFLARKHFENIFFAGHFPRMF